MPGTHDAAVPSDPGGDAEAAPPVDARPRFTTPVRPKRRVLQRRPPVARAPAAPTDFGTLSVNSDPWSEVYVDGKRIRSTPLVLYRLPTGRHTLELVNPARKLRATRVVTIRANRDTRLSIELR